MQAIGTFPYPTQPLLVTPGGEIFCGRLRSEPAPLADVIRCVIEGGHTTDDLARLFTTAWRDDPVRARETCERFLLRTGAIALTRPSFPRAVDLVIIDRGWSGVFQNAVDLWIELGAKHSVLLVAPDSPPEARGPKNGLLVTRDTLGMRGASFPSFMNVVRSLLSAMRYDVLLCTHRSVTPFIYDLMNRSRSIIHSDGHYERFIPLGEAYWRERYERRPRFELLQELSLTGDVHSPAYLAALYRAFASAEQNWFWTPALLEMMKSLYPDRAGSFELMMPLISIEDEPVNGDEMEPVDVLFTTTYGGGEAEMKGFGPVRRLLEGNPDMRARVVLGDESKVPGNVGHLARQIDYHFAVPKANMRSMYTGVLASSRVSEDDSSPVSVLEAMACGTPVIVSPLIAANIPFIENEKTAFVVEPNDRERFETIVRRLREYPALRKLVGEAGREAVRAHALEANAWRLVGSANRRERDEVLVMGQAAGPVA